MRMMMTVSIDTEAGNVAVKNGTLGSAIQKAVAELKPEAAYFLADAEGRRTGIIVFDMKDTSEIPGIAEPWFLKFNAKVQFQPVMNPQDLAAAGPALERAAKES